MSVKFADVKSETITETIKSASGLSGVADALKGGKKEGFAHEVGAALTKATGPGGYLSVRRKSPFCTRDTLNPDR